MSAKDGTIKYHYSPNQFSHNFQIYGLERRMFPQALKTAGNERQASPSLPLSPPPLPTPNASEVGFCGAALQTCMCYV